MLTGIIGLVGCNANSGVRAPEASRGRRAAALVVDTAMLAPLAIALVRRRPNNRSRLQNQLGPLAIRAVYVVPSTAMLGGTFGQLAMGLRVVDARTHRRVGWWKAFWRCAIDAAPVLVNGMWVTPSLRRLHEADDVKVKALIPELERLVEQYSDDPDELDARTLALSDELTGVVGRQVLFAALAGLGYHLLFRRSLRNRLTRTLVVRWEECR